MVAVLTVLCGLLYPLAMTGVAQALFADKADGSLIERDGEVVGSSLVGQAFSAPEYFHTRPSAAGALASGSLVQDVDEEGNPVGDPHPADPDDLSLGASGASNQGPTNPDLLAAIEERTAAYREVNGLADDVPVPIDAVTASGSGVDPHISVANARLQAPRVADERGLSARRRCSRSSTSTPTAGRSGSSASEGVNVLELNLALDGSTADRSRPYAAAMARGSLAHLPRGRPGRRQDLRHAQRGLRGAPSAARTWSSRYVETHGRPRHRGAARAASR